MRRAFDPWKGSNYKRGSGLLVLSESAYCWPSEDRPGRMDCPQRNHATGNTVRCWSLDEKKWSSPGKGRGAYARKITRMLCGKSDPTRRERVAAWNGVAYSIYVQRAMPDQYVRPSYADMVAASQPFLDLLRELRPARVLITGHTAWAGMPDTQVGEDKYLQAYRLGDGHLSWCKAIRHPRMNSWQNMAVQLGEFRSLDLRLLGRS
jgi:hypothetical protein